MTTTLITPYNLVLNKNIQQFMLFEGNIGCGVFIDLDKAFDTVEHDILSSKLEYHGMRGLPNNCLNHIPVIESKTFQSIVMFSILLQ